MSLAAIFARNLQALRQKKHLTQEALADKAGISVAYVSMLERGQRTPPLETIDLLAKALKVPVDLLAKALKVPALEMLQKPNTRKL